MSYWNADQAAVLDELREAQSDAAAYVAQIEARDRFVRRAIFVIAAIAIIAVSYIVATYHATPAPPYCPTEDSCRPLYDGQTDSWTIVETAA
jgi:hypothetical protein